MLRGQFPEVAAMLTDAAEDILAFTAFPHAHWRKIWSTSPLERLNGEIKRRTNVVGIFPNDASVLRLITAVIVETRRMASHRTPLPLRRINGEALRHRTTLSPTPSRRRPSQSPPDHLDPAEHHTPAESTYTTPRDSILGGLEHPEVSMHTPSLSRYAECLQRQDMEGIARLLLKSAETLAAASADFVFCPDNSLHQAFSLVERATPIPWLHIADVVVEEAAVRGFRRLGLTGMRTLVESLVYPEKALARGLECIRPSDADLGEIDRVTSKSLSTRSSRHPRSPSSRR